jgi:hypothetical protein
VTNTRPVTDAMLRNPDPGDWLMFRRTYDGQSYSPLDKINKDNVKNLELVWSWGIEKGASPNVDDWVGPIVPRRDVSLPGGIVHRSMRPMVSPLAVPYQRKGFAGTTGGIRAGPCCTTTKSSSMQPTVRSTPSTRKTARRRSRALFTISATVTVVVGHRFGRRGQDHLRREL